MSLTLESVMKFVGFMPGLNTPVNPSAKETQPAALPRTQAAPATTTDTPSDNRQDTIKWLNSGPKLPEPDLNLSPEALAARREQNAQYQSACFQVEDALEYLPRKSSRSSALLSQASCYLKQFLLQGIIAPDKLAEIAQAYIALRPDGKTVKLSDQEVMHLAVCQVDNHSKIASPIQTSLPEQADVFISTV